MLAIDGLKWLFSTSWAPPVLLRSIGFQLTNAVPMVKVGIVLCMSSSVGQERTRVDRVHAKVNRSLVQTDGGKVK